MRPRGRRLRQRAFLILLIFALLGFLGGFLLVYMTGTDFEPVALPFTPPKPPFEHFIAAEGLVESQDGNHFIGSPVSEIVEKIWVLPGDQVKAGDPLFKLNDIDAKHALDIAQREYDIELAKYQKQLTLPRAEDVPPLEADVRQRQAAYQETLDRFALYQKITNEKAVSIDEMNTKKYATLTSKYQLEEAEAELAKLKAGASRNDLAISMAELTQKKAEVERQKTLVERHIVRAPSAGTILKLNIDIGEYILASDLIPDPPLIMGAIESLSLRTFIDEEEIWRLEEAPEAVAFVRGNSSISVPLEFLRIEPFATPKKLLSGSGGEIVDTRVLPVVYEFVRDDIPVYPGVLMDVYIEAKPYHR